MPVMYDLTPYTGVKRSAERRMVVATFETTRRSLILTAIGAVIGFAAAGVLAIVAGVWGLVAVPVAVIAVFALASTGTSGLRVSRIRRLNDAIGARAGRGFLEALSGRRGISQRTGRVMVAGEELVRPRIVECIHVTIADPDWRPASRPAAVAIFGAPPTAAQSAQHTAPWPAVGDAGELPRATLPPAALHTQRGAR